MAGSEVAGDLFLIQTPLAYFGKEMKGDILRVLEVLNVLT